MSTEQPNDPEARMLAQLQQRYALRTGGGAIMIIAGAAVVFGSCLVIASIISFILWMWFDSTFITWFGWIFVCLLGAGVLVYREVKRSNESFFSDEEASGLSNPEDASSFGEYQIDQLAASGALIGQIVYWGPRALVNGFNTVRGSQPQRFRGLLARAATIVVQLYRQPDAMELKKLVMPGEPPKQFRETLKWLDDNDYVGIATDGKRVWLSSRVRNELNAEGFHV